MSTQIKNDGWNANLYDQKHAFVSQHGENLIELLAPEKGDNVLDLGCGTGDLAHRLSDAGAIITGVDQSENMIEQAQKKYPSLAFQVADACNLPFNAEFDAIFSNAVLHWIKTPDQVLAGCYRALKPGGRFVAEFGGKGNIETISNGVKSQYKKLGITYPDQEFPWYFPSIGEYTNIMESAGFHVCYAWHFDRPTPLIGEAGLENWLVMFGDTLLPGLHHKQKEAVIKGVVTLLKPVLYYDNRWVADYKRLRVIGTKL